MANNCNTNSNQDFLTPEDEILFLRKRLEEYQLELEEFQESSRELEAELEAQLSQTDQRNKELLSQNMRLKHENDSIKGKFTKLSIESQNQILELQKELGEMNSMNDRLSSYIRELEQSNDDLERAKRALDASLADFEVRLNQQIERNVLLENEIGEKEELQVVIQRLKDEARDLRQELMIQQNCDKTIDGSKRSSLIPHKLPLDLNNSLNNTINNNNNNNNSIINNNNKVRSNSVSVSNSETQTNGTPIKQTRLHYTTRSASNPSSPSVVSQQSQQTQPPLPLLSPSTRISALNIVSDLLRKVGALESKLASCRNIVPQNSSITRNGTINNNRSLNSTPINSPLKDIRDINANS